MNYIHIGLAKAASTTLQTAVFPRIDGIDFVGKRGVLPTPRNRAIAELTQTSSFQYDQQRVLDGLSLDRERPALISEEMCSTYSRIDPYMIACRLRSIVGDAKILLITREPEDWLNSMYFFRLERGLPDVFQDHNSWLRSYARARQGANPLLQVFYAKIFEIYESVFGSGSVTLLPFELLRRDPGRFGRAVAQFLDLPDAAIGEASLTTRVFKKRFTSKHFKMIRLLFDVEANRTRIDRLLTRHFGAEAESMRYETGQPIGDYRKMMVQSILRLPMNDAESARVSFDERTIRAAYAHNATVDRAMERQYGIRLAEYGYRDYGNAAAAGSS